MARCKTRIAVLCLLAVLPLSSCGSDVDQGTANRPSVTASPSPTRPLPSLRSSPDAPEPTEAQPRPSLSSRTKRPSPTAPTTRTPQRESQQATPRTSTVIAVPVPAATSSVPSPSSPPPSPAGGTGAAAQDSPSPAAWVAFGLLVAAAVLGTFFLVRGRKLRSWLAGLETARAEVSWFARELVPQLRSSGSIDEVAGGWRVARPRVASAEDQLTVLASSAPSEDEARRPLRLRDALRSASKRLERLAGPGRHDEWALDLDDVEALLRAVLEPLPGRAPGGVSPS